MAALALTQVASATSESLFGEMIELTDSSFKRSVATGKDDIWFVVFYAPWCDYAKDLSKEMAGVMATAEEEGLSLKFGQVNVIKNR